jgi:hypothetical protein
MLDPATKKGSQAATPESRLRWQSCIPHWVQPHTTQHAPWNEGAGRRLSARLSQLVGMARFSRHADDAHAVKPACGEAAPAA